MPTGFISYFSIISRNSQYLPTKLQVLFVMTSREQGVLV